MNRKWIFALAMCMCLLSFAVLAQSRPFDRFKSTTDFNSGSSDASEDDEADNSPSEEGSDDNYSSANDDNPDSSDPSSSSQTNSKDVFGRATGINSVKKGPEAKKLVQLNPETAFGPEVIESFNFPNTSLIELTETMQKLTGINLIYENDIKGKKVNILAPNPITVGDAWKAYLSVLNMAGYSLAQSGGFYKIVNNRDIKSENTKIYTGTYTPDTDNYVMRVIPLKYISSAEVTRNFRPFMTKNGRITDIRQTNTILAQDTGSNILRLVKLIEFVDIPGHEESLQIIQVKHSSAQEIAKLIGEILNAQSAKNKAKSAYSMQQENISISKIIAEPRTNSIIAMANAEGTQQLRDIINKLDVKDVTTGGQIHVYYLKHSDAEELSKTLSTLVGNAKAGANKSRFTQSPVISSDTLFNSDVKLTADKSNNAIVVTAAPTDYLTIKKIIEKLDIQRDQVYVEGLIMESELSAGHAWGISWVGAYGSGDTDRAGYGGSNRGDMTNLLSPSGITSIGGLFSGIGVGKKVELTLPDNSKKSVRSVTGLLTAIASNDNTNILATPQILALDNQDAVFEVGERIPTPKTTNQTNGTSQTSVDYQDVGLTLKLTPQINKVSRFVKLKIDYKMEDFSTRSLPSALEPIGMAMNNRSATTTVIVRDMDTIAMGGLMKDKEVVSNSKVPLLGDIPVLGWLFRSTKKDKTKTNLLFFLTPKILASYEDTTADHLKDLVNRRAAHLKDIVGDDDPFATTNKGLFEKAKSQKEGPLYNPGTTIQDGPIKSDNLEEVEDVPPQVDATKLLEVPNYSEIVQQANAMKNAKNEETN
ncbi:MAG: type II secretion system protein GspD [Bdellovibrionales bacterium RIFOXYA1_FULL_36_14]|nr:MAG: type II secretion system protein GspD [Bdellovibrionales bacterium RIFOXYA1_FULL_36_14]